MFVLSDDYETGTGIHTMPDVWDCRYRQNSMQKPFFFAVEAVAYKRRLTSLGFSSFGAPLPIFESFPVFIVFIE